MDSISGAEASAPPLILGSRCGLINVFGDAWVELVGLGKVNVFEKEEVSVSERGPFPKSKFFLHIEAAVGVV